MAVHLFSKNTFCFIFQEMHPNNAVKVTTTGMNTKFILKFSVIALRKGQGGKLNKILPNVIPGRPKHAK